MKPTLSGETIWMFISLLTLPVDHQLKIIGGVPHRGNPALKDYTRNNAIHLLSVIGEYYISWLDEFYPECPNAEALIDFVETMGFYYSYEDFKEGDEWNELRRLAKAALEEVGLEPWPVPDSINFNDYIEIIHPKYGMLPDRMEK